MNERRPGSISIGEEYDVEMRPGAEQERNAWREDSSLPDHFTKAGKWLREQVIGRSGFYKQHRGRYVAVISVEPPVMEIHPGLSGVLSGAYHRWGYRPVYTLKMDPSVLTPRWGPRPRAISIR